MDRKNLIIKICGVRNESSLKVVLKYRPSLIGLVFVPKTPRQVDEGKAYKLSKLAKSDGIAVVGVFQNQSLEEVISATKAFNLDFVQLHGDENREYCQHIPARIIKTIRLKDSFPDTESKIKEYLGLVDLFLIDRKEQGEAAMVDAGQVKRLARKYQILLAGGLNPDNISHTVRSIGPNLSGVDVSSGVEKNVGEKDEQCVKDFIEKARRAYELYH